jgi:DNA-binding PadR family transcriptional regulator
VLSVLAEGENYGYALIQRVGELSSEKIAWTEGMLYPVLHRLEEDGLIASEWRESDAGRKRKYYRIKPKGTKTLLQEKERWMSVHQTLQKLWQPRTT